MTISAGSRLGPYEILARIGAGGMGEVWRARDTRLDRSVAIKVLPPEFGQNAQLKARFEREARMISQLQHPHICTLFDVGDDYLVMELIEGETLAERLTRGPLALDEILRYGAQIADALDRAHRAGVIHRDLKPANVMITRSGAKLLDFGLAKSDAPVINVDGATVQKQLTQEGTILGTFQYMAPEQLEGEEADARSDIFALGAVLYEMATGKHAFEGKTRTSLIAAIVKEQPRPISQIMPLTPPALEHLIATCLEKDREDRWQSAHDVARELTWIGASTSQSGAAVPVSRRRRLFRTLAAAGAAVLAAAAAALATWFWVESRRTPLRVSVSTPAEVRIVAPNAGGGVLVSPDGRSLIFAGLDAAGERRLYVRSLTDFEPRPIALTEGAVYPFLSPDGREVGFVSGGKLQRVGFTGAPPVVVADVPDSRGSAWSRNGTILFAPSIASPLLKVPASGGTPAPATKIAAGHRGHRFPSFFSDGDHFLYYVPGTRAARGIWIGSLSSAEARRLIETRDAGVAVGDDELLYIRDGVLLRQRVDVERLALDGEPLPLTKDVSTAGDRSYQLLAASDAMLVFQRGNIQLSRLVWFDRAGRELGPVGPTDEYTEPVLSADRTKVLATFGQARNRILQVDLKTGRLTHLPVPDTAIETIAPAPDGSMVVSNVEGKSGLIEIGRGRAPRRIAQFNKPKWPDYFDSTGELLLVEGEREDARGDWDVYLARRSKGFRLEPLLDATFNESHAQLSPDARFVAYSSDESGRAEVYVQPVPPTGERWQLSNTGGDQAQWRGDGREVFYLMPDGAIAAVPIESVSPFKAGEPVPLFKTLIAPASVLGNRNQYIANDDGRRFLVVEPLQSPHANELSVITNWRR